MASLRSDAVLPSLFDRLTGAGTSFQGDSLYVSVDQYLKTVRRDISWLLKTEISAPDCVVLRESKAAHSTATFDRYGNPEPEATLSDYDLASASVVGFGLPMARGEIKVSSTGFELARTLERVVRAYEPRLDPKTLKVRVTRKATAAADRKEDEPDLFVFSIEIHGKIKINSVPQDLVFQAYYTPAFAQWRIEGSAHGT